MAQALARITIPTILNTGFDGRFLNVFGTVAIDANPATYATGGIVMNLSHPLVKAQGPPIVVYVQGIGGLFYAFVPGSTVSNGLLKLFTAVGTELGNGVAIPAGNSGDTITFEGSWIYGQS